MTTDATFVCSVCGAEAEVAHPDGLKGDQLSFCGMHEPVVEEGKPT